MIKEYTGQQSGKSVCTLLVSALTELSAKFVAKQQKNSVEVARAVLWFVWDKIQQLFLDRVRQSQTSSTSTQDSQRATDDAVATTNSPLPCISGWLIKALRSRVSRWGISRQTHGTAILYALSFCELTTKPENDSHWRSIVVRDVNTKEEHKGLVWPSKSVVEFVRLLQSECKNIVHVTNPISWTLENNNEALTKLKMDLITRYDKMRQQLEDALQGSDCPADTMFLMFEQMREIYVKSY
eukprot:c20867_g1_i1.p1 GENE.c20867_g1_i1~~c20867_g1_i1.p1  ORF type:complete len:240 (-),score=32.87 c20867_g1_i1:240-959(-)